MDAEEYPMITTTSPRRILRFVAHYYDRTIDELMPRGKTQPIAHQRHIAMWLCRQHTGLSYASIGKEFGGRDHATITWGVRSIDRLLVGSSREADQTRRDIARIEALLATGLQSPLHAHNHMSVPSANITA
jgi:chromosomal replication initiator protein